MTSLRALLVLGFVASVVCGCGGAASETRNDRDRLAPGRLYPLADGNKWSYQVDTGSGLPALAIAEVVSAQGQRYEVSSNRSEPVVYEVRSEGIFRPQSETWLLKAPIREGAEWPSLSGRTSRVVSVSADVETPGGAFQDCVMVEETGGEQDREIATAYCPDVGPVLVESRMSLDLREGQTQVTARLLGYVVQ